MPDIYYLNIPPPPPSTHTPQCMRDYAWGTLHWLFIIFPVLSLIVYVMAPGEQQSYPIRHRLNEQLLQLKRLV